MRIHNEQTKIVYDTSIVDFLRELSPKRVCLTSDPFMIKLGALAPVEAYLKEQGVPYKIFSDVKPNPDDSLVQEGLVHIFNAKPDLIVAIGGGSAIDLAKAIMYFCLEIKKQFISGEHLKKPYFAAVPTTSGTGSEVTNYTVITDAETGAKRVIQSNLMQPDAAVLDVSLTLTAPANVTADSGFDALTHTMEAYTSLLATPFSDAYALKAFELIFANLVQAFESADSRCAKENMQIAASLAGLAFNHSGLGINHSIAHSLGAIFHIPHGRANALVLPSVMAFNLKNQGVTRRYADLAGMLGLGFDDPQRSAAALIAAVEAFKVRLGLPSCLQDLGVAREQVEQAMPRIVEDAFNDYCTPSHPFTVTRDDVAAIVRELI
ncbi:iron-containing alcohol dehydrogenase [Desulfatibacillum aliphaticivorans]|uniref:iron-containing alcohol dehydrogenase n=1 Tax=Desulfatibacillum aliphaticivorans TaxID=218208 RepID=UPI00040EFD44|nr:iron-containing alcohol dehydrogenase [Desulfatibacillum aliphaticivorans]